MSKTILVTGSAGLVGSEAVRFFCKKGFQVVGIDNNLRKYFFGPQASTNGNARLLEQEHNNYIHFNTDIRNEKRINQIFRKFNFSLIIHAAAQPSHDWAVKEPLTDFTINALGTHNLLEAFRKYCPKAVFIFTSTNRVYGDNPNKLPLRELKTRYDLPKKHKLYNGVDETMSLYACMHGIFGVSKTAADLMVQEYGTYFKLKTGIFRGGCVTGSGHTPAQLHGFLAYLVYCIASKKNYTIIGYQGKQVRDNIHAFDLVNAFYHFYKKPRIAEVYNIGGSRYSNTSILEVIPKIEELLGKKAKTRYEPQNRIGDHIWYISDVSKFQKHYPKWKYTYNLDRILTELCEHAKAFN